MKTLLKTTSLTLGACALFSLMQTNAQVVAQWNFQNDAVATNNSPAASSGAGSADSIGMNVYPTPNVGVTADDVLVGATADTGTNGVADLTNIWRIRGQAGSSGAANGWSSQAGIGTQGAQFFASTAGDTAGSIKISFDWYSTTQGEANLQLEYTTNGGSSWNNLGITLAGSDTGLQVMSNSTSTKTVTGSYVSDNKTTTGGGQDWFTGLTATISDPSALNDSGFGIEMVNASTGSDDVSTQGTALNNTSGNWRFDNVSISVATPEPNTWALLIGGMALLVFVSRIRANRA